MPVPGPWLESGIPSCAEASPSPAHRQAWRSGAGGGWPERSPGPRQRPPADAPVRPDPIRRKARNKGVSGVWPAMRFPLTTVTLRPHDSSVSCARLPGIFHEQILLARSGGLRWTSGRARCPRPAARTDIQFELRIADRSPGQRRRSGALPHPGKLRADHGRSRPPARDRLFRMAAPGIQQAGDDGAPLHGSGQRCAPGRQPGRRQPQQSPRPLVPHRRDRQRPAAPARRLRAEPDPRDLRPEQHAGR